MAEIYGSALNSQGEIKCIKYSIAVSDSDVVFVLQQGEPETAVAPQF